MAICIGVAFAIGMIYLVILRFLAGVIIWFSIFAILGVIGGGGYWCYYTKDSYDVSNNNHKYLEYGAYALWGIDGAFFILIVCCCSRIRLAVAVMKVTGSFIFGTPSVLLVPIIFVVILNFLIKSFQIGIRNGLDSCMDIHMCVPNVSGPDKATRLPVVIRNRHRLGEANKIPFLVPPVRRPLG